MSTQAHSISLVSRKKFATGLSALMLSFAAAPVLVRQALELKEEKQNLTNTVMALEGDISRYRNDICRRAGPDEVKEKGGSYLGREWRFTANAIDPKLPDYARYGMAHVGCHASSLDTDKLGFQYMVKRPSESALIPAGN